MLVLNHLSRPGLFASVDLTIEAGKCVALSGPSGAGKSLLLRAVADLDPNEGDVLIDGKSRNATHAPAWRRRVGYLAAESGWWGDHVGDHFPLREMAAKLMVRLALPAEALDWQISRLSTGERQRLALVRMLIAGPRVMLLDEPTSSLDTDATQRVEALVEEWLHGGVTGAGTCEGSGKRCIIIVTHDRAQARRMADRHLTMKAGILIPGLYEGPDGNVTAAEKVDPA
ncbi:MAG: ATP-binding cassette domain-containing protein [Rhodospirillales bacterium]|nr:ATP-binding cassette domain-containing protein [Rhodospirillales bacterium]MCW8862617.1 ATP-binding cassette domain-containing protein [Rhodospirillales bacterium]MCW8970282.1 ATP-binding cassette domain-containing protein [Rhodospirillales bacterium]MCW9003535.1 ATP-binding cassette domain-containing protein [Rhodospirillales bacterium]